jgi:opacity protein-like surface antigen
MFTKKIRVLASSLAASACLLGGIAITAAPAQASANAQAPTYDAANWVKVYSCSYAGWPFNVRKDWVCDLRTVDLVRVVGQSGTFTSTGKLTSNYSFKSNNVPYCTYAWAKIQGSTKTPSKDTSCG